MAIEQLPLIPHATSPWAWAVKMFPEPLRATAEQVFRAQWSEIAAKGGGDRRATIATAHRYVRRAAAHPQSVAWAENRNARRVEDRADKFKEVLDDLGDALEIVARRKRGRR